MSKTKFILGISLIIFAHSVAVSQKVKLDDDKVMVDNVAKYTLVNLLNQKGKADRDKAVLKDMQGNVILEVRDTALYLTKLPYEKTMRALMHAYVFNAPQLGKSVLALPKRVSFIKNDIMSTLKDLGAFTAPTFTDEMFDKLMVQYNAAVVKTSLESLPGINERRLKNAEVSAAKFGALKMRTNEDFIDKVVFAVFAKDTYISDFHKAGDVNPVGSSFEIFNTNNKRVALLSMNRVTNVATVKCFADNSVKTFNFRAGDTNDNLLTKAGQYLVTEGYL